MQLVFAGFLFTINYVCLSPDWSFICQANGWAIHIQQELSLSPWGINKLMRKKREVSNEKNPGWLGYVGDYTTQLYRDYNEPL